ncbi:MAG: DUF5615 family PIN-like protein [Bacteroidetes bacterium]|nr:DUF5615 family PIN-like protein [Bacteroidota bacterium]
MKLLLDANLSWRIVSLLKPYFDDVAHVDFVIAYMANDTVIWQFAKENNYVIVSNDEDFINLLNLFGPPPKVVLLKTGNQHNNYIADLLIRNIQIIEEIASSDNYSLLELY